MEHDIDRPKYWVGIGASAGGLEALRAFVRSLPGKLDATYIIAQHLSPHHRSMLPEIIGRETNFEVLSIEDGVIPQPDKIYITPQDKDIAIDGDRLRLSTPSRDAGAPKPSVDRLFYSLAEQKGENSIAIVLSGTGSDGSRGVRDVRAAGGVTIAQDEMSAKYTGMPMAATESGCVDLVRSPEEIGAQFGLILDRRKNLDSLRASPVHVDSVAELIHLVNSQTNVNFHHYKAATLQRRIERRMAAVGVNKIEDYVAVARTTPSEVTALFRDFLISVTSFFRDPAEFDSLRSFLKEMVEKKDSSDNIRIWIPAVATGEEVYSIAMMLADLLGGLEAFAGRRVQLFASDIDASALEVARRGFYPDIALEEVPGHFLEHYMDKLPAGYVVKKSIRERVVFSNHNLVQDPPFMNIDFISCRNLLIYFQQDLQAQAFARFHYSLVPNGLLFLGKSETVAANEVLFRQADEHRHIFFQRPGSHQFSLDDLSRKARPRSSKLRKQAATDTRDMRVATKRFDSMVKALGSESMLVDEGLQILKVYGNINPFIELSSGNMSLRAGSLLKEPFGQDVRTAVPIVIRKGEPRKCVAHTDSSDPSKRTRLTVYPIDSGPNEPPLALAVFSTWVVEEVSPQPSSGVVGDDLADLIRQNEELRQELLIAQSNLQQTAEELETSNEELQALNEELQSSNEELQSTNEELETSNEELQSTNEELSTVNEELIVNSNELRSTNQSIRSILLNIGSPLIVVDQSYNITHVSHATETLFEIDSKFDLPHLSLLNRIPGFPDIIRLTQEAVNLRRRIDHEIASEGLAATVSVVPNVSESNAVDGAIIMIHDNTEALEISERRLDQAVGASRIGLWEWNIEDNSLWWSDRSLDILGVTAKDLDGQFSRFESWIHTDDKKRVLASMQGHLTDGDPYDETYRLKHADGTFRWVEARGQAQRNDHGQAIQMVGTVADVTERYHNQMALAARTAQLELAARLAAVGYWKVDLLDNTLFWSDQVHIIHGTSAETYQPELKSAIAFYHPEDRPLVEDYVNNAINNGGGWEFEARIVRSDGDVHFVRSIGQVNIDPSGDVVALFGVINDITDTKVREEELERLLSDLSKSNQELNRFSYVCSHDMKEPVRLIEALCEVLLDEEADLPVHQRNQLTARIGVNAGRLQNIIDGLLAYSRVDERIENVEIDLASTLNQLRDSLALKIEESNAKITSGKLPTVRGASVHFQQLLQNLITNAMKFSSKEAVEIHVSAKRQGEFFRLIVEDNGPGIPIESRDTVFEVFNRLHRRDEIDGSGLGLSICQRIAAQYDGTIMVDDSKRLGGARFTISIPREKIGL